MKAFIYGKWHCWQGQAGILLSDENDKQLHSFKNTDDCINWLYLTAKDKPAARALNKHVKEAK